MIEVMGDFSWGDHIRDDNIVRAAEFLLILDDKAIQLEHKPYAYRWFQALREQFDRHYSHTRKDYWVLFNEATRPTLIAQSFEHLRDYTLRVASLLNAEVQKELFKYLNDPNAPIPIFLFKENEEEVAE